MTSVASEASEIGRLTGKKLACWTALRDWEIAEAFENELPEAKTEAETELVCTQIDRDGHDTLRDDQKEGVCVCMWLGEESVNKASKQQKSFRNDDSCCQHAQLE